MANPLTLIVAMQPVYILGIESSCDETAAAVVRSGEHTASNVVFSQLATHQPHGAGVPGRASREHRRGMVPVVRRALEEAHRTYQTIDAIAVTQGPGLAGALLVGVSYAKALAFALEKPLITVNHLEGHIHAVLLKKSRKEIFRSIFRCWRWWFPAGTRTCFWRNSARAAGAIPTSAARGTMPQARPMTRWPSCWALAIPGDR